MPRLDRVDLADLLSTLPERRTPKNESDGRLFTIGPRWPKEEICFAPDDSGRRLVALTFAEEFADELDRHVLHPTLLDAAVSCARDSDSEAPHAPFGYESIVVHRSLPSLAYSYIRRRPSGTDTIVADIDVVTPGGRVAVEVKGFTMRRVDGSMVATEATPTRADDADETGSAEYGIAPEAGVELLLRILGQPSLRQVAVTLSGEDAVLKNSESSATEADNGATASASGPGSASTGNGAAAGGSGAGPAGDQPIEARLRGMWSTAFGVEEVAPDDDFFELGGDSLTAVSLVDEIRREFGLEVGIAAIFDYRTVDELAAELTRLKG